jgi:hypothetical protein
MGTEGQKYMARLLFNQIIAGFFVTVFLLAAIACVVYIFYVLKTDKDDGKHTFMRFFNIKYYREINEFEEIKRKKPVKIIYRYVVDDEGEAGGANGTAGGVGAKSKNKKPKKKIPQQCSISKKVYFLNGKPTLKQK